MESNQTIKQALHNTIDKYMQRAEKIKDICKVNPRRAPDVVQASAPQPQAQAAVVSSREVNQPSLPRQGSTSAVQPQQQASRPASVSQPPPRRSGSQIDQAQQQQPLIPSGNSGSLLQDEPPNQTSFVGRRFYY